jgi:Contractile injection system tube protein
MTEKARIVLEGGGEIPCLFNPTELNITKAADWVEPNKKGSDGGHLEFKKGQPGTMSLILTLDTTADGTSVTVHTDKLLSLVTVKNKGKTKNKGDRPPSCQFVWGAKFKSFWAVVTSLQLKFTYFSSKGVPLRAQATLSLKQFNAKDKWPQNPTSGTPYPHSVRELLPGQTLDRVAAEAYGDPNLWRLIAEANGILDPLNLPPGTSVVIPHLGARSRG